MCKGQDALEVTAVIVFLLFVLLVPSDLVYNVLDTAQKKH